MTTPTTPDDVRVALGFIPADDRDLWLRVGMAIQSEFPGQDGFALFDAWSQTSDRYEASAVRDTWRSFKPGKVTIGTLLHEAKARGYKPSKTHAPRRAPPPAVPAPAPDPGAHEAAARRANDLWQKASEASSAPYLEHKGIKAHGARSLPDGALVIPMHAGPTADAPLVNVQMIRPGKDGGFDKRFLRGGRKSGTMYLVGGFPVDAPIVIVTEGFATAASIIEAGRDAADGESVAQDQGPRWRVVVAWDAGNLMAVARALRAEFPDKRIVIAGDDDRGTKGNPGRTKAEAAARAVRGLAVFPQGLPEGQSDFNDLHQLAGLEAVRLQLEAALAGAQPRQSDAQRAAPHDAFRIEDGALWFDPPDDGSGGPARPVRVCGELRVTALARDAHDMGAALLLEFDTPFRAGRRWLMPLSMLAGDGAAYRAELLNQGFMVPIDSKRRALLTTYLQSRRPAELVRIVDRVGWHGRAYVLPRETLGDDGGERILFQSETPTEGTFSQRGTLDQWREHIGRLCVGNSRLAFAASVAFAAPLLAWASGTDGGGVHFMGDSSSGKTTALRVAASVYGGRDYLQRWRATDNGLEAMAAQHSDALLCLDELAQLDPRVAGESAYLLSNGMGKVRAGRTGAARPRLVWRLLFLSAGEIGLAEHMGEANRRTRAGQELRMVDLPADAGVGHGIFNELHGFHGGGALAQHLTRWTEKTYGTAGRAWLQHLCDVTDELGRALRERMNRIEAQLVPELASGQVQRVGRRFALVAAAGEMATEAGLTGWPEGTATAASHRCLNAWIETRPGGIGTSEIAQILRQVRGWFALHGDARFVDWARADDDHAPKVMNRAGWRKPVKTRQGLEELVGWEYYTLPDVFRTEVCKGFSERAALRLLHSRGHLHRESPKGFGCRASPPGAEKTSVYRIKSSILGESDDD